MKINILTLIGKELQIFARPSDTVFDVKDKIEEKEGIPVDQIRLIFANKQLEDDKSLDYYKIVDGCVLHMVLRLRGMISNFSEMDDTDPLTQYLLQGDIARVDVSLELLEERRRKLRGEKDSTIKLEYSGDSILTQVERKKLMGVANWIHSSQQIEGKSDSVLQDVKIVFPEGALDQVLGAEKKEASLKQFFKSDEPSNVLKLVVRRTTSTQGCIPWHVDGDYSRRVVQYTLNDDQSYRGGRLCFYTKDIGLFVPPRPAGTLTIHCKEMHGVSRCVSGVRYSLFVVDQNNGLGGEEANVVVLTAQMLSKLLL